MKPATLYMAWAISAARTTGKLSGVPGMFHTCLKNASAGPEAAAPFPAARATPAPTSITRVYQGMTRIVPQVYQGAPHLLDARLSRPRGSSPFPAAMATPAPTSQ